MATFHLTAAPKPGCSVDPLTCPLAPQDVMADSHEEAMGWGEDIIARDAEKSWEASLYLQDEDQTKTESKAAVADQWRVSARRVNRPAIALISHGATDREIERGRPVWYNNQAADGTYDVLVDGVVQGRLATSRAGSEDRPVWRIGEATGPLATLTKASWTDFSQSSGLPVQRWLEGSVLPGIRAALETPLAEA